MQGGELLAEPMPHALHGHPVWTVRRQVLQLDAKLLGTLTDFETIMVPDDLNTTLYLASVGVFELG